MERKWGRKKGRRGRAAEQIDGVVGEEFKEEERRKKEEEIVCHGGKVMKMKMGRTGSGGTKGEIHSLHSTALHTACIRWGTGSSS